jgi:VanZ family protein
MVVVMGTIYLLSAQPGDSLSLPQLPGLDKLAHMAAYGILALSILFAFSKSTKKNDVKRVVLLTVVWCLAYGITDEFHQAFVPGRSPSLLDLLADCIGAVMVCLFYLLRRDRSANLAVH